MTQVSTSPATESISSSTKHDVESNINALYRGWSRFEAAHPSDGGMVLDFDYCPPSEAVDQISFISRLEILEAIEKLQDTLSRMKPELFSNFELLTTKLRGSNAYVRSLMGEKIRFDRYIEDTLGITPQRVSNEELELLRDDARERLAKLGVRWNPEDLQKFNSATSYSDVSTFGDTLRALASQWSKRVTERLGIEVAPEYKVKTVEVDEYWSNWIDGKVDSEILLQVNIHPRIKYRMGQDDSLAAHEIAGHAVHILTLDQARRKGRLEGTLLNCTVHTCDIFQLEGIAQTVMTLIAEEGEMHEQTLLYQALSMYHLAVRNNAQMELEDGAPIDEVIRQALTLAPFLEPLTLHSDLRDRGRNAAFRCLIHVYYPAWKQFMRAGVLDVPKRRDFLREMYGNLWTPRQIARTIDRMLNVQG